MRLRKLTIVAFGATGILAVVAVALIGARQATNKSLAEALADNEGDLLTALEHVGRGDVARNESNEVYLLDLGMAWPFHSKIDDAGLEELKVFGNLEFLSLQRGQITDAGLAHLKDFPNLTSLYLSGTPITDAGLKQVENLTQLEYLSLRECPSLTTEGIERLKQALPNCTIHHDSP